MFCFEQSSHFCQLLFFSCKIKYFVPKIVKNHQFTWFCGQRSIYKSKLSPQKERSTRKYGKSPNEVSFFEISITGHPALTALAQIFYMAPTWPVSRPHTVHVVSMEEVPSRFGSTSFQSNEVRGALKYFWGLLLFNFFPI